MNRAYLRRQRQQERASAAMGVLGAILLGAMVIVVLAAMVVAWQHFPTAWWLPVEQRPFGGAL